MRALGWLLLFTALVAAEESLVDLSGPVESDEAPASIIHCDAASVCPDGTTCCLSPYGKWYCCLTKMGQCCRDGIHCCPYGFHCDVTSTRCLKGWLGLPSSHQSAMEASQSVERQVMPEMERCGGHLYCPAGRFCCRRETGQWGCCSREPSFTSL